MKIPILTSQIAAALCLGLGAAAHAADHLDAPAAMADPASDINDLYTFVNPNDPDELLLVMTVHPIANSGTRFSDAVQYRFNVSQDGGTQIVSCSFSRPDPTLLSQEVSCTAPGGRTVDGPLEQINQNGDLRVWAGLRDDPFFFDLAAFNETVSSGAPAFMDPGTDFFAGLNTLALVVGIDADALMSESAMDSTLKVWSDTQRNDGGGISAGITGSWWGQEAQQDGHGFHVEILERDENGPYELDVLTYWYNYLDGEQIFMVGTGRAEGNAVTIPLLITSGADFGVDFDSADVVREPAGTLTFEFSGCREGTASFVADGSVPALSDFDFPIQRLTRIKDMPCDFFQNGQVDRQGRPAVNTALVPSGRKDEYNSVNDPAQWAVQFQAAIQASLEFVDGLDGAQGNAVLGDSDALAGLLVDDRIIVDAGVPDCGPYLAVELGDTANCGGRTLDEDVIDVTLDALVAFGAGVGDGVDANDKAFMTDFPFLAAPNR